MRLPSLQISPACGVTLNEVVLGLLLSSALLFLTAPLWSAASRDLAATRSCIEQHSGTAKWHLPAAQQGQQR